MNEIVNQGVVQVPLRQIILSRNQVRTVYNDDSLEELRESMGTGRGQIYPILLHRIRPERYEVFIGSRRFKAAQRAKWETIGSVILEDISDEEMLALSLTENLQRENMNPFEEARGILRLSKDYNMSPKQISKRIRRPVPWIQGRLKILSVPEQVQEMLCDRKITVNHVGILASLKKPRDQISYAKVVAKESLSEADLVTLIQQELPATTSNRPARGERDASLKLFTPKRLGLKVKAFTRFLERKIKPQLALDGPEVTELRQELRNLRKKIEELVPKAVRVS